MAGGYKEYRRVVREQVSKVVRCSRCVQTSSSGVQVFCPHL